VTQITAENAAFQAFFCVKVICEANPELLSEAACAAEL
jgi:hypothetical protein